MTQVSKLLRGFLHNEEGASLVEYVLLIALIAVVCIAAVTMLGQAAAKRFDSTATSLSKAGTSP
jgi:pilus assembly protein Flp/PilA